MGRPRKGLTLSSISSHRRLTWPWRCRPCPWRARGRRLSGSRCHERRPPARPTRWPSRPSAAARESSGSTSPYAAWGCEAQPCRPASPSRGRDSRCVEQGDRANVRQAPLPCGFRYPAPSGAAPQSRSSGAETPRPGSSPKGTEGPFSRRSSSCSSVALRFATRPYRRIGDDRRKPLARYSAMESALRERLATPPNGTRPYGQLAQRCS